MAQTRSGLLLGVLIFYTILVTLTGLLLSGTAYNTKTDLGILSYIPVVSDVVTGFSQLPAWLNVIIFTPLIIIVIWVLVTSFVPTTNAGG